MIKRYAHPRISEIFSEEHKVAGWQKTELAVIAAQEKLGNYPKGTYNAVFMMLNSRPCDINWWHDREGQIHHDLQAWLDERLRWIPVPLQKFWHQGLTSYDTEESGFVLTLKEAGLHIAEISHTALNVLRDLAHEYRYTPMIGRTHGQWADLQSFGKRCLSWFRLLNSALRALDRAITELKYSKLSGAVGNYTGVSPEVEREALKILKLEPYYGATQILPRSLFLPLGRAVYDLVTALQQIALDIRLAARSGYPIVQEPFGKKQTGSSAMPHKKNTINTEKIEGMWRMAKGFLEMIEGNAITWEERAIEQSSVERVAWADLCHVTVHSVSTMVRVLEGLVVRPDVMLLEIVESRGTYAASVAKEILEEFGEQHGLTAEDSYRIVKLAAANVFEPSEAARQLRNERSSSLANAQAGMQELLLLPEPVSIQTLILHAQLRTSDQLAVDQATVGRWNECLAAIFEDATAQAQWNRVFDFEYLLRNEGVLYREILGK
ncbi:MAG: lyase family protein [Patescibacteria group bacterium]